ncbi:MAG TPA: sigma-70 family RNA polymerase sigma factor [Gemmataceae bacterium]|nr:sigma-70 family RNA polymerase sigma factor [Gemmataceae bacterium]
MGNGQLNTVLRHIHRIAGAPDAGVLTDKQLLARFAAQQDEAAFAALVERHGPMVLGVCRRLMGHVHDAEDVFQAAFLVLARRANAVRWREDIGNWLYEVACRLARKARVDDARRRSHESVAGKMPKPGPLPEAGWRELCCVLDEELQGLPAKYGAPLLLCYLEGRTRDQAARQLGWSLRTLDRRLGRGRELMRARLARRGMALSAALLATGLSQQAAPAAVPALLAVTTARQVANSGISASVATLAEGALQGMAVTTWKAGLALALVLAVLTAGTGLVLHQALVGRQPQAKQSDRPKPAGKRADLHKAGTDKQTRTDRYGDPLPKEAIARLGTVRLRDGGFFGVYGAAFAPDGKTIASTGRQGIHLWEAATGKELHRFGQALQLTHVVFSPDGKLLASTTWDDTVLHVWDAATGKELRLLGPHKASAVAFSADGKFLAAGGEDKTIRLWDPTTGRLLHRLERHPASASRLAFSPAGNVLASANEDNTVRLWDVTMRKELHRFAAQHPSALAFSDDGKLLASGSWDDNTIRLWDAASGKELHRLAARGGKHSVVPCLSFSPRGKVLASGHTGGMIVLWDPVAGKVIRQWRAHDLWVTSVAFSPDGGTLLSGAVREDALRLWDVSTGKEVRPLTGHHAQVDLLAFSPDGKTLFSGAQDKQMLRWDLATGRQRRWFDWHVFGVGRFALSPDGKTVATWGKLDHSVRLWDAATGKQLRRLGEHRWESSGAEAPWRAVAFSPDGRLLASADGDPAVRLWDVARGTELRPLRGLQGETWFIVFSPNGRTLAAAARGQEIRLWDVTTGKEVRVIADPDVYWIAFSPDGKRLASTGYYRRNLRLWDLATGKETGPPIKTPAESMPIAFSADGRFLAAASAGDDPAVVVWEVATRQAVRRFGGRNTAAASVAFSPDGRALACGGGDSAILLWDVTGRWEDGRLRPARLTPPELASRWKDLAGGDACRALQAAWDLTAGPGQAVPFLRKRLRPAEPVDEPRLARLIADLDSERFPVRERATAALEKLGDLAEPALRRTLVKAPSAEVGRRVQQLLEKLESGLPTGDRLRALRAVMVLEEIGTPDARLVLAALVEGAPASRLTQEAKASLERLAKRHTLPPR